MKKDLKNKALGFIKFIYRRLFIINDSPHRIALGFAIGAFLGFLPGTGPIASIFLAALIRVNKAAALLGSLLTNTWLSIVSIFLAIKTGSWILGLEWHKVYDAWVILLRDFRWKNLFDLSVIKILLPVIAGYIVIAFALGTLLYLAIFIILAARKKA